MTTIGSGGINMSINNKSLLSKPIENSNMNMTTSSFKNSSNTNNAKNLISLPIQQQQQPHLKPIPKKLETNNNSSPMIDNEATMMTTSTSKPSHYATSLPINNYPHINSTSTTTTTTTSGNAGGSGVGGGNLTSNTALVAAATTTTNPNKIYSRKEVITTYKEETKNTHSEEYLQTTTFYDTLDGPATTGATVGSNSSKTSQTKQPSSSQIKPIITAPKPTQPPTPPQFSSQVPAQTGAAASTAAATSLSSNPIYSTMPLKISTKLITTTTTQQNTTLLDVIDNLDYSVSSPTNPLLIADKNNNINNNEEEEEEEDVENEDYVDEGKMNKKINLNSSNKCCSSSISSNSSSSFNNHNNKNTYSSNINGILSPKTAPHEKNTKTTKIANNSSSSVVDAQILHHFHHHHHHCNPNELKLIVKTGKTSSHAQSKLFKSTSNNRCKKKKNKSEMSQSRLSKNKTQQLSSSASSLATINSSSTCENHSIYDNVTVSNKNKLMLNIHKHNNRRRRQLVEEGQEVEEEESLSFSLSSSMSTSSLSFLNELITTNSSSASSCCSEHSLSKFSFLSSSSSNRTVKSSDSSLSLSSALSPSPIHIELLAKKDKTKNKTTTKKKRVNFKNFNTQERLIGGTSFRSTSRDAGKEVSPLALHSQRLTDTNNMKISSIEFNKKANKIEKKIFECKNQNISQFTTKKRQEHQERSPKPLPPLSSPPLPTPPQLSPLNADEWESRSAKIMTCFGETCDLKSNKREEILNSIKLIDDEEVEDEERFSKNKANETICSFTSTSFNDVRKIVNKFDLNAHTRTITSGTTPIRSGHHHNNKNNPISNNHAANTASTTTTKLVKTIITGPKFMYERNESNLMEKILSLSNDDEATTTPILERAHDLLAALTPPPQLQQHEHSQNEFNQNDDEEYDLKSLSLIGLANFNKIGSKLAVNNRKKTLNLPMDDGDDDDDHVKAILNEMINKISNDFNEQ
jgi:hypothetical protein